MPILAIISQREGGGAWSYQFYSRIQGGRPTKHKGGRVMGTHEVGSRHEVVWYLGCKVMVLQTNQVGSWRWLCGFAHHY